MGVQELFHQIHLHFEVLAPLCKQRICAGTILFLVGYFNIPRHSCGDR